MIFEAGNETREKIWSDFGAEQKWRAERKECGFCSYPCFAGRAALFYPFYLNNIMIAIGYSFVGKNHFFVEKYDKKNGENWNYFS